MCLKFLQKVGRKLNLDLLPGQVADQYTVLKKKGGVGGQEEGTTLVIFEKA